MAPTRPRARRSVPDERRSGAPNSPPSVAAAQRGRRLRTPQPPCPPEERRGEKQRRERSEDGEHDRCLAHSGKRATADAIADVDPRSASRSTGSVPSSEGVSGRSARAKTVLTAMPVTQAISARRREALPSRTSSPGGTVVVISPLSPLQPPAEDQPTDSSVLAASRSGCVAPRHRRLQNRLGQRLSPQVSHCLILRIGDHSAEGPTAGIADDQHRVPTPIGWGHQRS